MKKILFIIFILAGGASLVRAGTPAAGSVPTLPAVTSPASTDVFLDEQVNGSSSTGWSARSLTGAQLLSWAQSGLSSTYAPIAGPFPWADVTGQPTFLLPANNLGDVSSIPAARVALNIDKRTPVADANYTMLATDKIVAITSITSARVLTLPLSTACNSGQVDLVVDESGSVSGTLTVTLIPQGSETINGTSSYVINTPYAEVQLDTDHAGHWYRSIPAIPSGVFDAAGAASNAQAAAIASSLQKSANLSDVANAATARQNIGTPFSQVIAESANFTASTAGAIYNVTTGSSAITVTLPTASNGMFFAVRKTDSGTGSVTVNGAYLGTQGHMEEVICDGTSFYNKLVAGAVDSSGNFSYTVPANANYTIATSGSGAFTVNGTAKFSSGLTGPGSMIVYAGFNNGGMQLALSRDGHSFDNMETILNGNTTADGQRDINILTQANDPYRRPLKVGGLYWAAQTGGTFGVCAYFPLYSSPDLKVWTFVEDVSTLSASTPAVSSVSITFNATSTITLGSTTGLTNGQFYAIGGASTSHIPGPWGFTYASGTGTTQTLTTGNGKPSVAAIGSGTDTCSLTLWPNISWSPAWYYDGSNYYLLGNISLSAGNSAPGIGYFEVTNSSSFATGTAPTFGSYTNMGLPVGENGPTAPVLIGGTYYEFFDNGGGTIMYATSSSELSGYGTPTAVASHFTTDTGGGNESAGLIQTGPTSFRLYMCNQAAGQVWYSELTGSTPVGTWSTALQLKGNAVTAAEGTSLLAGCPLTLTNYEDFMGAMEAQAGFPQGISFEQTGYGSSPTLYVWPNISFSGAMLMTGTSAFNLTTTTANPFVIDNNVSASYINAIELLDGSMASGNKECIVIGHDYSNGNAAYVQFGYTGSGSTSNDISFSFYNLDRAFDVTYAGNASCKGSFTAASGAITATNGNLAVGTAGNTLSVKSGANGKASTFTLSSGTATVSNTSVDGNSVIHVTVKTVSGTRAGNPDIVPTSGTGFTAAAGASDNSTYNYWIEENN